MSTVDNKIARRAKLAIVPIKTRLAIMNGEEAKVLREANCAIRIKENAPK